MGAIYAALHGVDHEPTFCGGLAYTSSEVLLWVEGLFGGFVLYEFDTHQQADAANVAYQASSLPIDIDHRRVMSEVLQGPASFEVLYKLP